MTTRAIEALIEDDELTPSERLVFVAYAFYAHSDNDEAWPGVERIARIVNLSPRQVIRVRNRLERLGHLVPVNSTRGGRATRYIVRHKGDTGDTFPPPKGDMGDTFEGGQGDTGDTFKDDKGDMGDMAKVTPVTPKGDMGVTCIEEEDGESSVVSSPSDLHAPGARPDDDEETRARKAIAAHSARRAAEHGKANHPGYLATVIGEQTATRGGDARRLAHQHPDWTIEQLADALAAPSSPLDQTAMASRALMERDRSCPDCHGTGMYLPDDADTATRCHCPAGSEAS